MNEEDIFDGGEPEPAVDPAPETEAPEPETPAEPTPEQVEAQKAEAEERKRKTGSQRAREKAERLERENQALRDALARGIPKTPEPAEPVFTPKTADGRPDPEDPKFKTYEDYLDALTDWKVESRLRDVEAKKAQQVQAETFHSKIQAAHEAHPDLADLLEELEESGAPAPTETMQRVIQASEAGTELLYHLAKNPAEVKRIGALPPVAQALEMGVLLGQIKGQTAKPAEPKTTKAPVPVAPVKGSAPVAAVKSRFEEF